ncbi:hypothetical protein RRG08_018808 [Elysia crispata]|uniref:Uncharacterized protein n=1 Tax=Elysia crispata TaxID=231223 RepID=A0AAE0ZSZ0_9GAST|nr:hypothetical protein RRG08_018808 [Elysia crispata]
MILVARYTALRYLPIWYASDSQQILSSVTSPAKNQLTQAEQTTCDQQQWSVVLSSASPHRLCLTIVREGRMLTGALLSAFIGFDHSLSANRDVVITPCLAR